MFVPRAVARCFQKENFDGNWSRFFYMLCALPDAQPTVSKCHCKEQNALMKFTRHKGITVQYTIEYETNTRREIKILKSD